MSSLSPAVGHDDRVLVSTDKAPKPDHPSMSNCGYTAASSAHSITSSIPLQSTSASSFDNHILPFIRYDVANHTVDVSVDSWVKEILGERAKEIEEWEKFFERVRVRNSVHTLVAKYCNAQRQEERYNPLCNILNTIIDVAFQEKSNLNLLPPPLGKINFYHNDPNVVLRDNGQDSQGRPSIAAISQPTFEKYTKIHHEEFRIFQEIEFLERDIAECASQISELQADKSSWTFGEDDNPVNHRISRLRQISSDATEKRRTLMSVLLEFRMAHRIRSNQNTSEDRGLAMTQISWYEILGPIEVKDTKPPHVLQAAFSMWNSIVEPRDVPPPSKIPVHKYARSHTTPVNTPSSLQIIPGKCSSKQAQRSKKRPLDEDTQSDQSRYDPRPKHDSSEARPRGGRLPSSRNPLRGEEHAASYALELLASANGIRSHCICILVDGEEVQFCYYDASGIIRSYAFDWFQNFEHFAAIVVAFGCLDLAGWGVGNIPNLTAPPFPSPSFIPQSLEGYKLTMNHTKYKDVEVTLRKPIFSQRNLVGRRTLVYNITTKPTISDGDLVLKMSWQVCTRSSEADILNQAKDKGVEHIPELHMWTESNNEYRISQGVRGMLFPDNKRPNGEEIYEDKSQRFMVFTKYEAITLAISPSNMNYIFMQLIDCLANLREILVIHRDLSITNLMHDPKRMVGKKPYFILNDFDLATFIKPDGTPAAETSSKHRTGTLPFMARDILKNPFKPHYLRHDLESAVYIAFWIGASYPFGSNGQPMKRNQSLLVWEKGNFTDIATAKTDFFLPGESDAFACIWKTIAEDFKPYGRWFLALRKVCSRAALAEMHRRENGVDEEYLNGMEPQSSNIPQPPHFPDKEDETMYGAITPAKIISALEVASCEAGLRDEVDLFVE